MIPCREFIPAYSELFKFLQQKGGKAAVLDFWNFLSDTYLTGLRDLVAEKGIRGCWEYWSKSLNEEAADFRMELDEDAGEFSIIMRHCPSKGLLNETAHIVPYEDYCGHCDVLYRRVLEPMGYECDVDLSETDQARCRVVIRGPKKKSPNETNTGQGTDGAGREKS